MQAAANTHLADVSLTLYRDAPHACPYLPDRTSRTVFFICSRMGPLAYQELMDAGYRRNGHLIYRPDCVSCHECVSLRVPVADFVPSRSQRRVLRRNADVNVRIGPPDCTEEKYRLFRKYLRHQHDGTMSDSRQDFIDFLYRSPIDTWELEYRVGKRLVAVGIVDVCPRSLSSVYFYFDPAEARRSLGVFGALYEIGRCAELGLPYWYVGYYIRDCRRMNYKARFRPYELLGPDGTWRPGEACPGS